MMKSKNRRNFEFPNQPVDLSESAQESVFRDIGNRFYIYTYKFKLNLYNIVIVSYSPLELWQLFIDDEVIKLIVNSSNEYAGQKNVTDFNTSVDEVKSFIGILYVTGYHTLPNIQSYWSNRDFLGCPAIKQYNGTRTI